MSVEGDLDTLYGAPPQEFVALRKTLTGAARRRGDAEGARVLAAARRPTVAAWVVNALVRADPTAKTRLVQLNAQLRAAHAAMDGTRIRELSAAQRTLVGELARAGFVAAGVSDPSAAVREDVIGTLQAAIADPEIAARLGMLDKAQEWSGFGDFGAAAEVAASRRTPQLAAEPEPKLDRRAAETRRRALAAAQRAHDDAVAAVSHRTAAVATARRRYEELLQRLSAAERAVDRAEQELKDANGSLAEADAALAAIMGESPL